MKTLSAIALSALVISTTSCAAVLPKSEVCARVTDKERIVNADTSKYLIFTDKGVFENTDDISVMKFNSSDFYAQIEVGNNYCFTVAGYRVPFLSMYQNIIEMYFAPAS